MKEKKFIMPKFNYSIEEKIYNVFCLINTKINYPSARLIRRPFFAEGKNILILVIH